MDRLLTLSSTDQQRERVRCTEDVLYYVNRYVYTYDPRLKAPVIPFRLFPKQAEFLQWLVERECTQTSGLAEKSRDMGFTWLCCAYLSWRWLFASGFKGAVGSRKFDLVDKIGDPDCIFEKIRFILQHLPAWLVPADYERRSGLGKLVNPQNGAAITGEGGDQIGRGGRSSIYFVDEAAFIEHPQKVDAALSANTNVRIDISTPNGNGNPFAQKRFAGNVAVFTMHWHDDPRKNRWELLTAAGTVEREGIPGELPPSLPAGYTLRYPWYEAQKRTLDEVTLAQEVDIDYTASLDGIAIPAKWVQAAVNLAARLSLPRHGPVIAAMDVADGGDNKTIFGARQGPVVFFVQERATGNTIDTAQWALEQCQRVGAGHLNYDAVGVGAGVTALFQVRARDQHLPITARGVNVGEKPTEARWPDGKTSREKFVNLKAELWETVRERFRKTYEVVVDGAPHPLDELISIPDDAELRQQLANVLRYKTETGKVQIERKEELRRRGVASPDKAEMLMLLFTDTGKPMRMAVGGQRPQVAAYTPR
jgi:hypothetical protein